MFFPLGPRKQGKHEASVHPLGGLQPLCTGVVGAGGCLAGPQLGPHHNRKACDLGGGGGIRGGDSWLLLIRLNAAELALEA